MGISLDREAATEIDTVATVDYTLSACQSTTSVNENSRCGNLVDPGSAVLAQNSVVDVCISTDSEDVNIVTIQNLDLTQKVTDVGFRAIGSQADMYDGSLSVLTDYSTKHPHIHCVSVRLISSFFEESDPDAIDITGQALLEFAGEDEEAGRRMLSNFNVRRTQQTGPEQESSFFLEVELQGEQDVAPSSSVEVSAAGQLGAAVLALGIVFVV